jgi:hypothetical protein
MTQMCHHFIHCVIASEARGNLTQSVILSEAKNLVEILRALPSG